MSHNVMETMMGAVVLAAAGAFMFFAYNTADLKQGSDSYNVIAKFDNVGGINPGSDVRVSGIKVGSVLENRLDPESFRAVVKLSLRNGINLPADSSASISSDGLLGGKYVAISPGGDVANLKENSEIKITQSSVSIEELIGKFVFSGGGVDKNGDNSEPTEPKL